MLEAVPDAIVGVDEKGRIVLVNGQTDALFGYSRSELIGETLETLTPERFRDTHRISTDITDRKRAEALQGELAAARELAIEKMRASRAERAEMERHTTIGYEILAGTHFDPDDARLLLDNLDEALVLRG